MTAVHTEHRASRKAFSPIHGQTPSDERKNKKYNQSGRLSHLPSLTAGAPGLAEGRRAFFSPPPAVRVGWDPYRWLA